MGGGKIKIIKEKLFDLGSREESKYQEVSHKEMDGKEEFVLKANNRFSKSFLSRIIRFTVDRDNLAAIVTYDSDKDFSED